MTSDPQNQRIRGIVAYTKWCGAVLILLGICTYPLCVWIITIPPIEVLPLSGLLLLVGFVCLYHRRITRIKIKGIGEIETAWQKAVEDAEQIAILRQEIERQKDSVSLIVRDSNRIKEQLNGLEDTAKNANNTAVAMARVLDHSTEATARLRSIADFNLLVMKAINDDRKSFDQLVKIAETDDHPLRPLAMRLVHEIHMVIDPLITVRVDPNIPWPEGVDPNALSIEQLRDTYKGLDYRVRPKFLSFVWAQERFTKLQRLKFLCDVIRTETSLRALHRACRLIDHEAKLGLEPAAAARYLEWCCQHSA